MKYELPKLSYAFDSLEPHIDEATMRIHYGKHHQTYVDKLNMAIDGYAQFDGMSVDELLRNISVVPEEIKKQVINNGGGHSNHSIYWTNLSPNGGSEPMGHSGGKINETFGDFEKFKKSFTEAALSFFGSGWIWLVRRGEKIEIISRPNQDSPLLENLTPLLALDLWEHAYYLKHQNKRADYVEQWWNVVNWEDVERRYNLAN
jgi:Fe-Mn family superoxide dismutase